MPDVVMFDVMMSDFFYAAGQPNLAFFAPLCSLRESLPLM